MPDLRPGQLKRLGRISENNPERADKVADRMEKRASRTERGAAIASNAEERRTGGRSIDRVYDGGDKEKQQAVRKMTSRDYPLSPTPEPVSQMRGKTQTDKSYAEKDAAKAKAVSIMRGKGTPEKEGGTQGTIKRLMGN